MSEDLQSRTDLLLQRAGEVLLGKTPETRLALCALLANGHLLINDLPGVGKTTLVKLLAKLTGLGMRRIQFTSDLLPADITGVSVFERDSSEFRFHPGPIFSELVLADEINRATPRTQSALLEAMEERQVSVEGETMPLPDPFFVIATQNPAEQVGVFSLPESQLDRFLLCIQLGYPDPASERRILADPDTRRGLEDVQPVLDADSLRRIQLQAGRTHCSDALLDYVQAIVSFTRGAERFLNGYSPRAAMGILAAARAWAWMQRRDAVIPEDVQAIIPATVHHLRSAGGPVNAHAEILQQVPVP